MFKNLGIGTRLSVGFGAVIALMIIIMGVAMSRLAYLNSEITQIADERFPTVVQAQAVIDNMNLVARAMRNVLLVNNPQGIRQAVGRVEGASEQIEKGMKTLDKSIVDEAGRRLLTEAENARSAYSGMQASFIGMINEGRIDEAKSYLLNTLADPQRAYIAKISALIEHQNELVDISGVEAHAAYSSARNMILVLAMVALIIAGAVAWFLTRSIVRPLNDAVRVAGAVAAGDLTQRIDVRSNDETGKLMEAMKHMNESLVGIVGQVRGGTETIAVASRQIATGNADLSSRTESQASSLEETASSMEELTSTVKQN
ncbi:MAG: hypothetical protein B7Z52_03040, partial [Burkholderiales bacterium 12-64-5]